MTYGWDASKAAANWKKHGVSFEDAATVFLDPLAMTYPDHSAEECREITRERLVFVCHCERGDRIPIVSARLATRLERRLYEEGIGEHN